MRKTEYIRYFIGFIESLVLLSALILGNYSLLLLILTTILVSGKICADLLDLLE